MANLISPDYIRSSDSPTFLHDLECLPSLNLHDTGAYDYLLVAFSLRKKEQYQSFLYPTLYPLNPHTHNTSLIINDAAR